MSDNIDRPTYDSKPEPMWKTLGHTLHYAELAFDGASESPKGTTRLPCIKLSQGDPLNLFQFKMA